MAFTRSLVSAAAVATLVVAAGLVAPPAHAAEKPAPIDLASDARTGASSFVKISDAALYKGIRRVGVPSFQVEFITSGSADSTAREIGKSGSNYASSSYKLVGVAGPELQPLVDRMYADFTSQLVAAGYEVVPAETLRAAPAWRKMTAAGVPSPMERGTGLVLSPAGMPVVGTPPATGGGLLAGFSALASVSQMISGAFELQELSNAYQATMLNVWMRVSIAEAANESAGFLGRISGTASTSVKFVPMITEARVSAMTNNINSFVETNRPLVIQGEAIREVRDTSSLAGNVALNVLKFAIAGAGGGGGSAAVKEYEAVAEPVQFNDVLARNAGAVQAMLIARMSQAR